MMFEHLVLFKFNDKITPEKEKELLDMLLSFQSQISGIIELTAGMNVTEETDNIQGYTLGLRVTFQDREALRQYGPHPVHREFGRALDGLIDNVVVMDYPVSAMR